MVHQHFTGIPAFTVAENVALATGWPVTPGALSERVRQAGERIGLPLDPDVRTGRLSVGLKQRLEIVKAVAADARILLLDEPTAVLAPAEVAELLDVIRRFTASGGAAVLITHKLDEALAAADRVTVLRRGAVVLQALRNELDAGRPGRGDDRWGTGPAVSRRASATATDGPPAIRAEALEVARESGYGLALRQGSLEVRPGEIVGVAAVEGNGQRELLRAVAGRVPPLRGRLEVARPVAFIPEDRTSEGLIPELTLTENVVLGSGTEEPWIRGGRIDWRVAERHTAELLLAYDVVAAGPRAPASSLSGGNQQKVVIARELSRRPRVVVAENPTRGLDLRATAAVHVRLRARGGGWCRRAGALERSRRGARARGAGAGRESGRGGGAGLGPDCGPRGDRSDDAGRRLRCPAARGESPRPPWGWGSPCSPPVSCWPVTTPVPPWPRSGAERSARGMPSPRPHWSAPCRSS